MIETFDSESVLDLGKPGLQERAIAALESGRVVHLPRIGFEIAENERPLTDPLRPVRLWREHARASGRPTLIYYQRTRHLRSLKWRSLPRRETKAMMDRFADWSRKLVHTLLPAYEAGLEQEYTTFRPAERSKTQNLHMDAIPRRPTQGRSMLRVFTNVNGAGIPRGWHVGGSFQPSAEHFAPQIQNELKDRVRGTSWALRHLGFYRAPVTPYDRKMLQLRELIFRNEDHQRTLPHTNVEFPVGSTWIALTDVALHGARAGQHSLDQTFLVDVSVLRDPERSSLRILEKLTGRKLV